MNKKKLILGEPVTKSYLFDAYPLSILAGHGDAYFPWLLSNYIQIDCFDDLSEAEEMFLVFHGPLGIYSPYLKTQKILWSSFVKQGINVHSYIKNHIDDDYYMYFQVDDYYNPDSPSYGRIHHTHDLMIYGYDDNIKKYSIVFYNEEFVYSYDSLDYDLFELSFYNNSIDKDENPWADQILMFKYNKNGDYNFNINLVKFLITEYLDSKNSFELLNRFNNPSTEKVYGIEVLDKLQEHTINVRVRNELNENQKDEIDLRAFRIIKERAHIMIQRLKYMNENIPDTINTLDTSDIIEEYKIIKNLSVKCFNLSIKYNLNFNNAIPYTICKYLSDIKQLERNALNNLLKLI